MPLDRRRYTQQTVSGAAIPILKKFFLTLTLGRLPQKFWVLAANITHEFILGQDILRIQ
jgi:hypothetical protein